jgi:mannosyltransferase
MIIHKNFLKLIVAPIGLFIANLILKFLYIDSSPISLDEPVTIYYSSFSFNEIPSVLIIDNHPPLFYFIVHYWNQVFSLSPVALRTLPLIFSALSVIIIYEICRRFINLRTAIVASMLYTASNTHIFYSHDFRMYSIFFFLTCLSFLKYLLILKNNQLRSLFYLTIINTMLCYLHFFGILIIFFEFTSVLLIKENRKFAKVFLYSAIANFILYLPYLKTFIYRLSNNSNSTWIPKPKWDDIYTMLRRYSNAPVFTVFFIIVICIGSFIVFRNSLNTRMHRQLLFFTFAPLCFIFLLSFIIPMFVDRYIIFFSLFYYILIAVCFDRIFPEEKYFSIGLYGIMALFFITTNLKSGKRSDVREVVEYVKSHTSNNTLIVLTPEWYRYNFAYYYNRSWLLLNHSFKDTLEKNNILPLFPKENLQNSSLKIFSNFIVVDENSDSPNMQENINLLLTKTTKLSETHIGNSTIYEFRN